MNGVIAAVILAAGLLGGFLLGRSGNAARKESRRLDEALKASQAEFATYRRQVTEHFSGTAQLLDTLTQDYRNIYQHLASGAGQLCGEDTAGKLRAIEGRDLAIEPLVEARPGEAEGGAADEAAATTQGQAMSGEGRSEPAVKERAPAEPRDYAGDERVH